jgi:MoaA/NifB/PqqE/SkfB family radical SAM enzyme
MNASVRPGILHLEITDQCNQACPMCATRFHARSRTGKPLDRETIRDRILTPGRALEFFALVVSGGEPLLAPHLQDTLQDALSLGFGNIFVATNLFQINPALMDGLLTLLDRDSHALQVSLDSHLASEMNAIRGKTVFDPVVKNVRRLLARRQALHSSVLLTAQLVLQAENAASAPATVRWVLDDLRLDKVMVQLRHDYTLPVTPGNVRLQSRPAYAAKSLPALMTAVENIFALAATDPRVCPDKGTLEDWQTFLTDPQKIQKKCTSTVAVYIDAWGNLRGCALGDVLGNLETVSLEAHLGSQPYRQFLRFSGTCRLCTHACS